MYPTYINLSSDDFKLLFDNSKFKKATWKKSETLIKGLFDLLQLKKIVVNTHINETIINHFNNKKGNTYETGQLSTMTSRNTYLSVFSPKYKSEHILNLLVQQIEKMNL